jgi:hypothetical protein
MGFWRKTVTASGVPGGDGTTGGGNGSVAPLAQEALKGASPLSVGGLRREGVERVGCRQARLNAVFKRPFAPPVPAFTAGSRARRRMEGLDPLQGTGDPRYASRVWFNGREFQPSSDV